MRFEGGQFIKDFARIADFSRPGLRK